MPKITQDTHAEITKRFDALYKHQSGTSEDKTTADTTAAAADKQL